MFNELKARLYRIGFNLFPAYRGTGARITHIEPDWSEIRAKVPLNWRTRNYVGVTFGGSMYGAIDPLYMMMLIQRLGDEYVVWDKAATIDFEKPGRETLYARCRITDEELAAIKADLRDRESTERVYTTRLVDEDETVHATVRKTVYITTDESKAV
jgi:acyl-coenzyme A thioesterase PaaI-like protein